MSNYQLCPPPDRATNEQTFATWENGFSDSEIADIIKVGNALVPVDATINKTVVNTEIRKAIVSWIGLTPDSQFIYDKMGYITRQLNGQFFEFDLYGFVEDLQYTVYQTSDAHYDWHMDKGVSDSSPRKLSLVLQLSDENEYEGGDLELMTGNEVIKVKKQKGLVYVFPSWILHRVTPVTAGTRKSLVMWVAGPKFR